MLASREAARKYDPVISPESSRIQNSCTLQPRYYCSTHREQRCARSQDGVPASSATSCRVGWPSGSLRGTSTGGATLGRGLSAGRRGVVGVRASGGGAGDSGEVLDGAPCCGRVGGGGTGGVREEGDGTGGSELHERVGRGEVPGAGVHSGRARKGLGGVGLVKSVSESRWGAAGGMYLDVHDVGLRAVVWDEDHLFLDLCIRGELSPRTQQRHTPESLKKEVAWPWVSGKSELYD
jgi:hypothetical protein